MARRCVRSCLAVRRWQVPTRGRAFPTCVVEVGTRGMVMLTAGRAARPDHDAKGEDGDQGCQQGEGAQS